MKMNFKNILIIFLVALLGSGLGTFGMMSYFNRNVTGQNAIIPNNVVINEVEYTNVEKNDYTKAIEKAVNTVVEVQCTVQTESSGSFFFFGGGSTTSTSSGSGVIISEDGYIVTNAHVINGLVDEKSLNVKLYTGETLQAKVIGYDTRTDLAVLKIDQNNLPYASLVDSSQLILGQNVIAIGNPLGLGISVSDGIISALEKEIYVNRVYMTVIQTNAAVNEGNSGGGLFDTNGNLVGIVNAKKFSNYSSSVEGMGFAIPANTVLKVVNELMEYGYVKDRASLGIKVYTGSSYYTNSQGVLITEVIDGGGAKQAGIKENDIITAVDDTKVSSYADLSKILDSKDIGDTVEVTVIRENETLKFNVTLQSASN